MGAQNVFVDPGQDRLIDELFAWVAEDPRTGLEGICGVMLQGQPFQACSSSRATIEKMRPFVIDAARATGKPIRLVRFSKREIVETI